nr:MAG TPA: hypothetical protein [Caudoviricetes sp.]
MQSTAPCFTLRNCLFFTTTSGRSALKTATH